MLQPRTYPELMGKALVLEPEPFTIMVDDDNPWAEGLFMVLLVGVVVGLAQFVGGLLTTASLPTAETLLEVLLQGWRQSLATTTLNPAQTEDTLRQIGLSIFSTLGLAGAWSRLLVILVVPMLLLIQWLFFSVVTHAVARMAGGIGSLNQTLGAMALMVAPQLFSVTALVPFASAGGLLLLTWSVLISYRAVESAHELPWRQSVVVALVPLVLLVLLAVALAGVTSILVTWGVWL